jgi:hypothetical protein
LIILGDFNDYEASPPLLAMTDTAEGGILTNVLLRVPERERYSYNFGGVAQLLDTILVSAAVDPLIISATILHFNADYPMALQSDTSPEGLPYQVSDHDVPVIVLAHEAVNHPPGTEETPIPAVEPVPTSTPTSSGEGFPGWGWLAGTIGAALLAVLALLFRRRR